MITVYSRPGCMQCTTTYRALDRKGLPYRTIDVSQDTAAARQLRQQGHQALPVVTTDTDAWSGFRPDKIAALPTARHPQ